MKSLSRVRLFATPLTVAYEVPPSMGFSRREYWSGLPFPSPGDLPHPGIEPASSALQMVSCSAGGFFTTEPPRIPNFTFSSKGKVTELELYSIKSFEIALSLSNMHLSFLYVFSQRGISLS